MKKLNMLSLAFLLSFLGTSSGLFAATLFVPSPAYPTIMSAIVAAQNGDEVEVSQGGFYLENIDFLGKAIRVYSLLGPQQTFLQSPNSGGPVGSVVTCRSGEGPNTILEGFHISGGGGTPDASGSPIYGLGMFNLNSSPTVKNCIFMDLVFSQAVDPLVYGGGMANITSSPTIIDCVFQENQGTRGGGIYNTEGSQPEISRTLFLFNAVESVIPGVDGAGGAVYSDMGSAPSFDRCRFENNFAFDGEGAAIYATGNDEASTGIVVNSLFTFNLAVQGAAIATGSGHMTVTSCTFAENTASLGGTAASCIYSLGQVTVGNCIFWDNAPANTPLGGTASGFDVTWSDVQGGWLGFQNIAVLPGFASGFSLNVGSPCVDRGNDFADIDTVAAGIQNIPPLDLPGNPRFQDDPSAPNLGDGNPPIDLGCFERDGVPGDPFDTSADFVRGDTDGNGVFNGLVDGVFVLAFGFSGGAVPPCMEAADADGNGVINALVDGVYILAHQFGDGPPPPPPYPECGPGDPDSDLGCDTGPAGCSP